MFAVLPRRPYTATLVFVIPARRYVLRASVALLAGALLAWTVPAMAQTTTTTTTTTPTTDTITKTQSTTITEPPTTRTETETATKTLTETIRNNTTSVISAS